VYAKTALSIAVLLYIREAALLQDILDIPMMRDIASFL
jgi:hypothetical protein